MNLENFIKNINMLGKIIEEKIVEDPYSDIPHRIYKCNTLKLYYQIPWNVEDKINDIIEDYIDDLE